MKVPIRGTQTSSHVGGIKPSEQVQICPPVTHKRSLVGPIFQIFGSGFQLVIDVFKPAFVFSHLLPSWPDWGKVWVGNIAYDACEELALILAEP